MKQFHIAVQNDELGDYVILTGDPGRAGYIASFLENADKVAENREFTSYSGFIGDRRVGVLSTGIGGPSAAIAVEEAVRTGTHTFIRVGTAGGISTKVTGGDEVIATGAVRQEGTALHYAPIEYPAVSDFSVTQALCQAADEECERYHVGVIQSKDSFYGQHSPERSPVSYELLEKWESYKRLGVLASEMECASIFTVAASLGVRAGAVLHILWNKDRQKLGMPDREDFTVTRAVAAAVRAIEILIEKDK